jgi:hypothetical protein
VKEGDEGDEGEIFDDDDYLGTDSDGEDNEVEEANRLLEEGTLTRDWYSLPVNYLTSLKPDILFLLCFYFINRCRWCKKVTDSIESEEQKREAKEEARRAARELQLVTALLI